MWVDCKTKRQSLFKLGYASSNYSLKQIGQDLHVKILAKTSRTQQLIEKIFKNEKARFVKRVQQFTIWATEQWK